MRTLLAIALFASTTNAEMPLVSLGYDQPAAVSLPGDYRFMVRNFSYGAFPDCCAVWDAAVAAFPVTETASAAVVAELNRILTRFDSGTPDVFFYNDGQNIGDAHPGAPGSTSFAFETAFMPPGAFPSGIHWGDSVPKLGDGLFGYRITRAERTITSVGQTVTLYGVTVVPEPSCFMLLLAAAAHLVGRPRR